MSYTVTCRLDTSLCTRTINLLEAIAGCMPGHLNEASRLAGDISVAMDAGTRWTTVLNVDSNWLVAIQDIIWSFWRDCDEDERESLGWEDTDIGRIYVEFE